MLLAHISRLLTAFVEQPRCADSSRGPTLSKVYIVSGPKDHEFPIQGIKIGSVCMSR
jgi:hypothetical protein